MKKINFKELFWGIFYILIYLVVLPVLVSNLCGWWHLDLSNVTVSVLANMAVYILAILMFLWVFRKSIFGELKAFFMNFKTCGRVAFFNWLKGLVFMMLTNIIIISLAGGLAVNEAGNREMISALPVFSALSMIFFGPFLEEVSFRKSFRHVFKSDRAFLIFTSLLFGGAHLLSLFTEFNLAYIIENWTQLLFIIPYSGFGYFLGKAYLETDNIFTSIFAHMFHNTLSVLLILMAGA